MALAMSVASSTDSRWSMSSLISTLPSTSSSVTATVRFSQIRCTSFTAPHSRQLHLLDSFTDYDHGFPCINNGSRFFCMRHGRKVPKLNRPPNQRKALTRALTTQPLKHGRIKTTRARASGMRKYMDNSTLAPLKIIAVEGLPTHVQN